MKTVILYYTFSGSSKKEAERLSQELSAPVIRVKEAKNRSLFSSFIPGGFQAMRRKAVAISPSNIPLEEYDRIIIGCPIWANYPAPAFNTIIELLPSGKEVELFFCSGSGLSNKSKQDTIEMVEKKGCVVISYRDVKTNVPIKKMRE